MRMEKVAKLLAVVFCIAVLVLAYAIADYNSSRLGNTQPQILPRENLGAISNEDEAVGKVSEFIVSKVGEEFFDKYISFHQVYYETGERLGEQWRGVYPGVYQIVYYFEMPEYDFVDNEIIWVIIAPDGEVLLKDGIPDPERCDFIGESEAIEIAERAGVKKEMELGIESEAFKALGTGFNYHAGFDTYIWSVSNITGAEWITIDGKRKPIRISGESILIDANSGEVLERGGWMAFIN